MNFSYRKFKRTIEATGITYLSKPHSSSITDWFGFNSTFSTNDGICSLPANFHTNKYRNHEFKIKVDPRCHFIAKITSEQANYISSLFNIFYFYGESRYYYVAFDICK
jgi:hypothetical protein